MASSLPALTVLTTSVGNDGFPSVLGALRANGERDVRIVGVDANPAAVGLRLIDDSHVVPPRNQPASLLDQLEALCEQYTIDVLAPLSTEDQEFYAHHRARFERLGVRVATSAEESLANANDKLALLEVCSAAGVPCPRYYPADGFDEVMVAAAKVGYPAQPFVVKLNRGTGAQGVKIVDPHRDALTRLFDRDNIRIRPVDLELGLADLADFPQLHVTEYLPGDEFSVDVLCHEGRVLACVVRLRKAAIYGLATHAVVVDEPDVAAVAAQVVGVLGLSYVINVQLRRDQFGQPRLMEVNPRIPGTIALTVAAGINMPYLMLKLAVGEPLPALAEPAIGREFLRYWSGHVQDVAQP